jgi:peptide-methionine (S)-S-oxide reductase
MKKLLLTALSLYSLSFSLASQADTAIFAGGCFWCMESDFQDLPGVASVISGYIGGHLKNPRYKQVSAGNTGHFEAIEITYNPSEISYQQLLEHFWVNIDPFDDIGQFCDKGSSYLSAIFTLNDEQEALANNSKIKIQAQLGEQERVVTPIINASKFYPAEARHQDYYQTNAFRYKFYRYSCGRDERLEAIWGAQS